MNKKTLHRAISTLAVGVLACACWVGAGLVSGSLTIDGVDNGLKSKSEAVSRQRGRRGQG